MRNLFFVSIILFTSCSDTDNLRKELQAHKWYIRGENWQRDRIARMSTDSLSACEWSASFLESGKMIYSSFTAGTYIDTSGLRHEAGESFTDTSYTYELRNKLLKVTKQNISYYLQLEETGKQEFKISPESKEEFEKQKPD